MDGHYRNSDIAASLVVSGTPGYQGGYIEYVYDILQDWITSEDRIRLGPAPRATYYAMVGQGPTKTEHFMAAMYTNALPSAEALLLVLDLSECNRILDVGCGTGTYGIAIAAKYRSVKCDLIDLPATAAIAETYVQTAGLEDRVSVSAGNYPEDDLPLGYDAVLLLAIIHQEAPAAIEGLLRKIPSGSIDTVKHFPVP
jgi:3-hydroxy-5-methyl-1-naphthoate 3-O-methyltransferase